MPVLYKSENLGKRVEVFLSLSRRYPRRWLVRTHDKAQIYLNGKNEDESKGIDNNRRPSGLRVRNRYKEAGLVSQLHQKWKSKKKDVHAWVIGTLVEPEDIRSYCTAEELTIISVMIRLSWLKRSAH